MNDLTELTRHAALLRAAGRELRHRAAAVRWQSVAADRMRAELAQCGRSLELLAERIERTSAGARQARG